MRHSHNWLFLKIWKQFWHRFYGLIRYMCCASNHVQLYVNSIELTKVVLDNVRLRIPRHIPQFLAEMHKSRFIDCDQDQAAQFRKEFGPLTDEDEATQFAADAHDVLSAAKTVLDKLGIQFWISSGTCLGEWYCYFSISCCVVCYMF